MKKKLLIIVVILSMLMAYTGTALAAGSGVELVSAHAGMSGTVFIFKVSGEFSGAELKGLVQVGDGREFTLDCRQLNAETVRCLTSFKVQGNVNVTFGGGTFWTYIHPFTKVFTVTNTPPPVDPPIDPPPPTEYCYGVWDWWNFTGNAWTDFGPECQDAPAQAGDPLSYTVPAPGGSFNATVWFYEDDLINCNPGSSPWVGPAYYYPSCPN